VHIWHASYACQSARVKLHVSTYFYFCSDVLDLKFSSKSPTDTKLGVGNSSMSGWCQMPIWRPFVYHAKTPYINQVVFMEIVSHLALCSSCCYESPLCCANWSSRYFDVILYHFNCEIMERNVICTTQALYHCGMEGLEAELSTIHSIVPMK
jgi:hypothetical protein